MSALFDPTALKVYEAILAATVQIGDVRAEEKRRSVHLVARMGFAGVHPRRGAVVLNVRSAAPIASDRIHKHGRVSARRFNNEMLIDSPAGVDHEVIRWLKSAYDLNVGRSSA